MRTPMMLVVGALVFTAGLYPSAKAWALPPPSVTSLDPAASLVGNTLDVTVSGQDFVDGATVDLGPNTVTNSTTFIASSTLIANVTIEEVADPGPRDVLVTNPDLQESVLENGFELIPTPRHYVDPAGSNEFPYTTSSSAAHSLSEVLTAVGEGDSILVASGTFSGVDTHVQESVSIVGAWSANFTSRDVVSAKTVLQLSPNIVIDDPPGPGGYPSQDFPTVSIDGFVFEGGTGRYHSPRAEGGAILVTFSNLTVSNCEFRNNTALSTDGLDGGGAILVEGSASFPASLNVFDCDFHDNESDRGGAINLDAPVPPSLGLTAHIANSTFTNNVAAFYGGAVWAEWSGQLVLENNVFEGHSVLYGGGSVYASYIVNMQVVGGSFSNSDASMDGGGLEAIYSTIFVEDVAFTNCTAGENGGAVGLSSHVSGAVRGCRFEGCGASLGGTLAVEGGTIDVDHNLFSNNAGIFPAALIENVTAGGVLGNTVADNTAPGPALSLGNSPVTVSNNIVVNNVGFGIGCSGASLPTLSYNDVFANAAGDYSGCAPGLGSVSVAPVFVDPLAGDYHLGIHSPAIDAGDPSSAWVDPDGGRGDMGWYGSHDFATDVPSTPALAFVDVGPDAVVHWSANLEPDVAQYIVYGSPVAEFTPSAGLIRAIVPAPTTSANLGPAGGDAYFKVCAVDVDGYSSGFAIASEGVPVAPQPRNYVTRMLGNTPNPFNPSTTIRYEVATTDRVILRIYDVAGRMVRELVRGRLDAGVHETSWNGRDEKGFLVASGTYFCRLEVGHDRHTAKVMLVK
jgi:hypothetical protein